MARVRRLPTRALSHPKDDELAEAQDAGVPDTLERRIHPVERQAIGMGLPYRSVVDRHEQLVGSVRRGMARGSRPIEHGGHADLADLVDDLVRGDPPRASLLVCFRSGRYSAPHMVLAGRSRASAGCAWVSDVWLERMRFSSLSAAFSETKTTASVFCVSVCFRCSGRYLGLTAARLVRQLNVASLGCRKGLVMDIASLFALDGRTALVTGGSRGIGRMIAEGFLAQGATVFISSRKVDACRKTAEELGERCFALPMDVSTVAGCASLATAYSARAASLDILVNNAGASWGSTLDDFPEQGWDKVMDLNVKSPFFLVQKFHTMLQAAARPDRPAKVINIGSIDGQRLNPWETYSYHASKAALHYLTRRLAAQLVRENINVNAIAPGSFASDLNRSARDHAERVAPVVPAGRIGRREDIAAAAIYLASGAGDYVVGDTLTVDGGFTYAEFGAAVGAPA